MYSPAIQEEELKLLVAKDHFSQLDCNARIGKIDFCVKRKPLGREYDNLYNSESENLLWAEAKTGNKDLSTSITQLILTIGNSDAIKLLPPPAFLGAFDSIKILFIPFNQIYQVFTINDFNWKTTPSNHASKEFKTILSLVENILKRNSLLFKFEEDKLDLHKFIRDNINNYAGALSPINIDKNNFVIVYNRWSQLVKPTINVNWTDLEKENIIDCDFYLADLLSHNNYSLKEGLYVSLQNAKYILDNAVEKSGLEASKSARFKDNQQAHTLFWNRYNRPPAQDFWDYIIERRDLLVPQDIRERRGSFFTPQQWVEESQRYLANSLGENWQDEYYVWDCAAGTGNLLTGLTNKYRVFASTIDIQDVDVMKERIKSKANLLENNVFKFDFLNDSFETIEIPKLKQILYNEEERKKLVIYINPPYAEHGNRATINNKGQHKDKVATTSKIYNKYSAEYESAMRELYIQFFVRIYNEIPGCIIASFSTIKFINSQNFNKFRSLFKANLLSGFICNANSFDNVRGSFPIGFMIWDTTNKKDIKNITVDILPPVNDENTGMTITKKTIYTPAEGIYIKDWLRKYYDKSNKPIGYLILPGVDVQQHSGLYFTSKPTKSDIDNSKYTNITILNLVACCVYLAVRRVIRPNWLNNKDQFLHPTENWIDDYEFQSDCIIYSIFTSQNKITTEHGENHWIPFTESEVNSKGSFNYHTISDFLRGKINKNLVASSLHMGFSNRDIINSLSLEASSVYNAGLEIWKAYHRNKEINFNASLYDIKMYYKGRNEETGKMNLKSNDALFNNLESNLSKCLMELENKIKPKIYLYAFIIH